LTYLNPFAPKKPKGINGYTISTIPLTFYFHPLELGSWQLTYETTLQIDTHLPIHQ
jgi:hypothetical protein